MKLLNFTIVKLTLCLALGIGVGCATTISLSASVILTAFLILLLAVVYINSKKQLLQNITFGLVACLCTMSIGLLTVNFHNPLNAPLHYTNKINISKHQYHTLRFSIRDIVKPGLYHNKYVIDLVEVDGTPTFGKLLLQVMKDSVGKKLQVDDSYIVRTCFEDIAKPLNPGQFNYKAHLNRNYIHHQLFVDSNNLLQINNRKNSILGAANTLRNHINSKLAQYNFKAEDLSVINALLLGQRQDLSEDIYKSYVNAGAIHILAVSGLHVGIILILLSYILKPLETFEKGLWLKTVILLILLWSFAVLAGLSASVTRAVTMFSIVAIGNNLNRPTNIYNTLCVSIFILLLFKPLFLLDVGFQLSYMAVFAIVAIDPILYKLWQPKNRILNLYWHTLTVTIAAQLGILPLSLYYFHKFPALFFVSNLIIIPFLGIILGFGIFIIILAVLNILPQYLATLYGFIIHGMNRVIGFISQQEAYIFKNISFSLMQLFAFYMAIAALFMWVRKTSRYNLKLLLKSVIIVQIVFILTEIYSTHRQLIIFHKNGTTVIAKVFNKAIYVANPHGTLQPTHETLIRDYAVSQHITTIKPDTLRAIYGIGTKTLLVVDSLAIYNLQNLRPDYVLLRQSPKLNLERLIKTLNPKVIIADGSNYKSSIAYWDAACKKGKIQFHATSKHGAFSIDF